MNGIVTAIGRSDKFRRFKRLLYESNKELIQGSEPQTVQIVRQGEITPYQFFSTFAISYFSTAAGDARVKPEYDEYRYF